VLATGALVAYVGLARPRDGGGQPGIAVGQPAPEIDAAAIDGTPVRLSALRGRPVIVNFWGPSCVPCRDEFPLFTQELATHADDGLTIVGVLMFDPPETARDFIADYGATWPTVDDPDGTIRAAYRAAARPQTYFIDAAGIVRSIQVGQTTAEDFERQYAKIAP
jgi:peroxiredoxin